jgi:hypothetical protein
MNDEVRSVIRLLAALTLSFALAAAPSDLRAAIDECTPEQWNGCRCVATPACEGAHQPSSPEHCIAGLASGCSPHENGNGICTIQCFEHLISDGVCGPQQFCE